MKKLFAFIFALVLALSLVACGGKDNSGDGGSSTQQGGNNANKSNVWTDADAQTVSVDKKLGHYEFTVWDAKNTTEIVSHPGSPQRKITTTGYTEELYAPFKIVYTNTTADRAEAACAMYVMGGDSSNAIIYTSLEGDTVYKSSNNAVGPDGKVEQGETITVIGYIELSKLSDKTVISFTLTSIGVEFFVGSRPVIQVE